MTKRIDLIADDFGLSPSVSSAIVELAMAGRLSGTGCMVVFPDWAIASAALLAIPADVQRGLHLTLTDFPLLGKSMPPIKSRVLDALTNQLDGPWLRAACDWQLDRFVEAFGSMPDFIDGHQHVHLLAPVRDWIIARFSKVSEKPWIRGTPQFVIDDITGAYKSALLRLVGRGHNTKLRAAGFCVASPLLGFYDWKDKSADYANHYSYWLTRATDGTVIMCHPGRVDDVLTGRDAFTHGRQREFDYLASSHAPEMLDRYGCRFFTKGERQTEMNHA